MFRIFPLNFTMVVSWAHEISVWFPRQSFPPVVTSIQLEKFHANINRQRTALKWNMVKASFKCAHPWEIELDWQCLSVTDWSLLHSVMISNLWPLSPFDLNECLLWVVFGLLDQPRQRRKTKNRSCWEKNHEIIAVSLTFLCPRSERVNTVIVQDLKSTFVLQTSFLRLNTAYHLTNCL